MIVDRRSGCGRSRQRLRIPIGAGSQPLELWPADATGRHLGTDTFIVKPRNGVECISAITYDGVDSHGMSVAYPGTRSPPTRWPQLRPRHADAGTPVDVLRELIDHTQVETTMGYDKVSIRRRRAAVAEVSELMVVPHGHRRPIPDRI